MDLSAPCPPLPGRPFFLKCEGGKIYISVHDRFYLEKQREFKRRIRARHPDTNKRISAARHTRDLLKLRERFRKKEIKWYAQFGLEPPEKGNRCNQKPTEKALLLG